MDTLSWPDPVPGLVIRYAYLWQQEAAQARLGQQIPEQSAIEIIER